jgi:DNA-binding LytR/AlgR family response regulator
MQDFLYVKDGSERFQIFFSEIKYLEAKKRYVRFVTVKRDYLAPGTLYEAERRLPGDLFCRIHKSYIISLKLASQFNYELVRIGDKQLPIGREYRDAVLSKVYVFGEDANNEITLVKKEIDKSVIKPIDN